LPKKYSFQWVRFDILWPILWGIESVTFDGFPTRYHRARNRHVPRWVKIFFKFSDWLRTMLVNALLHWTKPGFVSQIILIGSGFHMMNRRHLSRNKSLQLRNYWLQSYGIPTDSRRYNSRPEESSGQVDTVQIIFCLKLVLFRVERVIEKWSAMPITPVRKL
jgi:hypothetical protein